MTGPHKGCNYVEKTYLTRFMSLVSFYTYWKLRFFVFFRGQMKKSEHEMGYLIQDQGSHLAETSPLTELHLMGTIVNSQQITTTRGLTD